MSYIHEKGAKPIIYGERTFKGWESYYALWGTRKPKLRTISSHYAQLHAEGWSDEQIIAEQKMLWIDDITRRDIRRAREEIAKQ